MQYHEIRVNIQAGDVETASAICHMTVPYGIYIEDYSDLEGIGYGMPPELIDEELLKKDRDKAVIHIYIDEEQNPGEALAFLRERMTAEGLPHSVEENTVDEEDYAHSWKKYYHPIHVGDRLVVVPDWEDYTPKAGEIIVDLEPGMAFGTGSHETTRLCMALLEKYTKPGTAVLDVGCGSGILAVTSVLLGAERAVGCDIDPLAVKVAGENAKLNRAEEKTRFLESDLTSGIEGQYGIVCANIVADVVIRLCDQIPRFMAHGGIFISSGIIDTRAEDVRRALAETGFSIIDERNENGWAAFAAVRKA